MRPAHLPSATYRLQLNQDFRFADVRGILDYLQALGISHLYLSPVLASRKGSGHGYDVTDPTHINPDLGTEEEFVGLLAELQNRGLGLLLDTVPNHMAASAENPWWMDVLENGVQSSFAGFFDIDWHPPSRNLDGRILLPVLGRPFGEALESGELKLLFQDGKFFFQYFDSLFPLAPKSYHTILGHRDERIRDVLGEDAPAYHEFSGILASLLELVRADRRSAETASERRLRYASTRGRLASLAKASPEVAQFLEENVREINGRQGDPASFAFLQRLLAEQSYKLSFWQNLNESINYRRFFTIADLVGVRVEDPIVFEATHGAILRLVAKSPLAGLRIDHIDGLRDPLTYLNQLQERLATGSQQGAASSYIVVEKILEQSEDLPADWPVSGTTGYDYLNAANGLFVEPQGARRIEEIYAEFIGRRQNFDDVVYQKKKLVMSTLLGVEMLTLGRHLCELAAPDRYARELSRTQLIDALIEVTACLSIYRTYIRNMDVPAEAVEQIEEAVARARKRSGHISAACFDFVREVLLLLNLPHVPADQREARLTFVMRWQQFTGPIVAKGLEDTALYVYHPLLSLNEVGGNPTPSKATSEAELHRFLEKRLQRWPGTLNAATTHDTKRSEDVRARISVLSEIPEEWKENLEVWAKQNAPHRQEIGGQAVPDRNEEYFLYQTLLGIWPLDSDSCKTLLERVQQHLIKATREAMVHTRWTLPNQQHEEALRKFATSILSPQNTEFLQSFRRFQSRVAYFGMVNGLSQTLLKIASPGVADFYQGSELWDLRLVDPDNRGPVDFEKRKTILHELELEELDLGKLDLGKLEKDEAEKGVDTAILTGLFENWEDGRIKLHLISKALCFRRKHEALFGEGEFVPLSTAGKFSRNISAFLRRHGDECALVAVSRWLSQVTAGMDSGLESIGWQDTRINLPPESPARWNNIFERRALESKAGRGDQILFAADIFRVLPVALLAA